MPIVVTFRIIGGHRQDMPRGTDRGERGGPSHNQRASWRQADHNLVLEIADGCVLTRPFRNRMAR